MKVTYNGTEYELKYSFRALMIYENAANKTFQPKGMTDVIIFFYSCILAAARTAIDFDEFIDWLDDNPNELTNFSNWLTEQFNLNEQKAPKPKGKGNKKSEKKKESNEKN